MASVKQSLQTKFEGGQNVQYTRNKKRKAAGEDGEDGGGENGDVLIVPPRQQAMLAGSLHRYPATERVEKLTKREKCWRKGLFDAL